jgi:SAM-dependent methyltransferase
VAAQYEHGRPGYSREAIGWALGSTPLQVLDLGAGTGKLTGAIADAGHRVIALEPLSQMREILIANLPAVTVLDASAEQIPLADGSVDAVLAGAAFHWFDRARALPEIVRVLRAPGTFALFGNAFDRSVRWVAQLGELLGSPRLGRRGHWPSPTELGLYFDSVEDRRFSHEQLVDPSRLEHLASSRSSVATLPHERRQELLSSVAGLWETEPELIGRTEATLRWRNDVRVCRGLCAGAGPGAAG